LLGLIWALVPSFPENVPLLGGVNLVLTALAAGVFCTYLRKVLDLPGRLALALSALIWISPHLWRVASVPLSEPLYLLTFLLALWAGGHMEKKRGVGPVVLFLLAGGCVFFTRTLGVAMLVAGAASLLSNGRRRAAFFSALGSLAVLLPWAYWSRRAAESLPGPLLDTLGPYSGWLGGQIRLHPWDFCLFVFSNAGRILGEIISLLTPGVPRAPLILGWVVFPLLLLGLWELFKRSRILPIALFLSIGIVLVWPFVDIRLLVPFQPLLILGLAMGFWTLLNRKGLPGGLRASVSAGALAWVLLFASVSIHRLANGWTTESYRVRSAALMDAVRAVTEKTPQDAVVGAPESWAGLQLYTGRTVVPSARFHPLAGAEPVEGTPEEQYEIWIGAGVTHLLVEHGGRVHGAALDRVEALCPPGTLQVLDTQPGRVLVALAWDAACQERVMRGGTGPPDTTS
jgi:hypothetical protein